MIIIVSLSAIYFPTLSQSRKETPASEPILNRISKPIQATIKLNVRRHSGRWPVYSDPITNETRMLIDSGAQVMVGGWAPWRVYVFMNNISGYVSWKAVRGDGRLDSLLSVVATQSDTLASAIERMRAQSTVSSSFPSLVVEPQAPFTHVGECIVSSVSFQGLIDQLTPLRWKDLAEQISLLIDQTNQDHCWTTAEVSEMIEGSNIELNGKPGIRYDLFKIVYCPVQETTIQIPSLRLEMQVGDKTRHFVSKPVSIPVDAGRLADRFVSVGNYTVSEKIIDEQVLEGKPVLYEVVLSGAGNTFTFDPPDLNSKDVKAQLYSISYTDTVKFNTYHSSHRWVYKLVFQRPGTHTLILPAFEFFNKRTGQIERTQISRHVSVKPRINHSDFEVADDYEHFVALDISESMALEDVKPTRRTAMLTGFSDFMKRRKTCDIGVATFSDDVVIHRPKAGRCLSPDTLKLIDYKERSPGSAMLNVTAFLLRINSFTSGRGKLVLIGDGGTNAGIRSYKLIAELARAKGVRLFTIGVGTEGSVLYQSSPGDKPVLVNHTFDDKPLRYLAEVSGGAYYHAKDSASVEASLTEIFSNP